ncbi:MAG: MOSC domain-containing protein [Gemmatimonadaceae bacterium]|nr:MOSC domain-containing protein [Gemmatimonadaceae bacterium]
MRAPRVTALFVHPIKSAAAIPVDALALDDRGAVGDRRWLVIDDDGVQITARETSALAMVRPYFANAAVAPDHRTNTDGPLLLDAPGLSRFSLRLPATAATRAVRVWADTVDAHDAGDAVAAWMSEAIRRRCRVVRLAEHARRPLAPKYAGTLPNEGRRVAFSDGAPLLILSQASVDALSARLVEQGATRPPFHVFAPIFCCRPRRRTKRTRGRAFALATWTSPSARRASGV